ncbi:hypothetical protein Q1M63_02955 (plasmid) [Sinorhizobium meliloti]|nr:hypothetical protein Q1M63_02955 [Sinorhizobium meliloti]
MGTILGITSNTVDFHIKGAMKRLGGCEQNGCRKRSRTVRTDRAALVILNVPAVFADRTSTNWCPPLRDTELPPIPP